MKLGKSKYRPRRSLEELAIDLLFETFDEHRYNRTPEEYEYLCSLVPPLKEAHYRVNQRLKQIHDSGKPPYEICYFKDGDLAPVYFPFPTSISAETIRNGLVAHGFRIPKWRKQRA
jgi:hypothetical protein